MITVEKRIRADRATVWQTMSDLDRWAKLLPTIDEITRVSEPGPITVGARFRIRQPGLPTAEYEVTDWRPEAGFTWEARTAGVRGVASHLLHEEGTGTRVRLGIEWSGPGAWLVRALISRKAHKFVTMEVDTFAALAER